MNILIFVLEVIGTIAFAVSGAMTALKKNMDLFGVIILGCTTAVGGGIIRDLILGITPPMTFRNPVYAFISIVTAVIVFLPGTVKLLGKNNAFFDIILLVMDALGLGVFTVMGIRTAYVLDTESSVFLMVFVGVITGVGGGVMRDIMSGNTPYIFVKHFYATASLIGALLCAYLIPYIGLAFAMISGAAAVVTLRFLAAKFHWKLPKYKDKNML